MSKPWEIIHGDVQKVCKTLEANSFDAVLCDPPYGLSFMGRRWDYAVPSAMTWNAVERVMKPGAHAMIFGGPRTFHRVVVAAEDGGLIPRDLLHWFFGSGFPKSTNISKGIDRKLGKKIPRNGYQPISDLAKSWKGSKTSLKPGYEPILLARKFFDGTVSQNAMLWGVGGLAIDECRVGSDERFVAPAGNTGHSVASVAPVNVTGYVGQTVQGRWPTNVILSHSFDCRFVGSRVSKDKSQITESTGKVVSENKAMSGANYGPTVVGSTHRPDEEVWECAEGCPVRMLDEQSGERPGMSGGGKHREGYAGGMFGGIDAPHLARGDSGGASRFFYTAKADRYQREAGLEDRKRTVKGVGALRDGGRSEGTTANTHPTVKPLDLIRYLATLILPPKRDTPRRILVPFCGVSSEMIGCIQAGWDEVVGIEREAEYIEIAKDRITKGGVFSGLLDRSMRRKRRERESPEVDAFMGDLRRTSHKRTS